MRRVMAHDGMQCMAGSRPDVTWHYSGRGFAQERAHLWDDYVKVRVGATERLPQLRLSLQLQ